MTADESAAGATGTALVGTSWQLVSFQSSDDAIGTLVPQTPDQYSMALMADGKLAMKLDCNRASGSWSASPIDASSGSFTLSPLAMTRAACPPGSLDTRIARDASYVRSYVRQGDELNLSLMADGGIYRWRRAEPAPDRR